MSIKVYHVEDLMELFGVTRRTIYNYLSRGELIGYKVANKWIFTEEQVLDLKGVIRQRGGFVDEKD